jgi:hypothetical protein
VQLNVGVPLRLTLRLNAKAVRCTEYMRGTLAFYEVINRVIDVLRIYLIIITLEMSQHRSVMLK